MHYLAALINASGAKVAVTSPCFWAPSIPVVSSAQRDDIAIYPDSIPGNPLGAGSAIRWMLYFAGAHYTRLGGVRIPKSEYVLVYMRDYLEEVGRYCEQPPTESDILEVPNIESAWCFPETKTVESVLFRGKRTCSIEPKLDFIEIPNASEFPNRSDLRHATLQLLRKTRNVYTMDHHTVLEQEAILCGCKVWRVMGETDFAPSPWTEPEARSRLMNPPQDIWLAQKLIDQSQQFFGITFA